MTPKTYHECLRLAEGWLQRHLGDPQHRTPALIRDALLKAAEVHRPNYWIRVRRALVVHQEHQGFHKAARMLEGTQNPVALADRPKRKPRRKGITLEEHKCLMRDARQRQDGETMAALTIARHLGARPAEMPGIQYEVVGQRMAIFIPSAKVDEAGERGLDRFVTLPYDEGLVWAIDTLHDRYQETGFQSTVMKRVQDRLYQAAKVLWPRRQARPSLYSYRHQLGSDLKASGLDRRVVAAVMGHRSQDSVTEYGNARSASSWRRHLPQPSSSTVEQVSDIAPRARPPQQVRAKSRKPGRRRSRHRRQAAAGATSTVSP